jgi:hypothetical protein
MPDAHPRKTIVNVSWSALFKVLAVVVLVWLWLQLVQLFLVLVVALLLAVSLNPIVAGSSGGICRVGARPRSSQ